MKILLKNFQLIEASSEETIIIPLENLLVISKLNVNVSFEFFVENIKLIFIIFIKHFSNPSVISKITDLIVLCSSDIRIHRMILEFIFPMVLSIFDDFFICNQHKQNPSKKYSEIRKIYNLNFKSADIKLSYDNLTVK